MTDEIDPIYNQKYFSGYGHNLDSDYETLPFIKFTLHELADFMNRVIKFESHMDVGCAMGFMVQKMRELGKESYGIDISSYAISRAPEEVKPYVWIQDISQQKLDRRYDLVTCVETVEHIEPKYENRVLTYLTNAASRYLYFSSEQNYVEATHVNVHARHEWLVLLEAKGFKPISFQYPYISHGLLMERY